MLGHTANIQDILSRPRRNRRSPTIRGAISETHISPANLILPVFIHDGEQSIPIASMPGVARLGWRHGLMDAVAEARSYGVNSVVLFPKVLCLPASTKSLLLPCAGDPPPSGASSSCLVTATFPVQEIFACYFLAHAHGHMCDSRGALNWAGGLMADECCCDCDRRRSI